MSRPRIVDEIVDPILKTRIEIIKSTHLFSRSELTKNWDMSLSTLYRYLSEDRRNESVEYSRRRYRQEVRRDTSICIKCNENVKGHATCEDCGSLTHNGVKVCAFCTKFRNGKVQYRNMLGLMYDK